MATTKVLYKRKRLGRLQEQPKLEYAKNIEKILTRQETRPRLRIQKPSPAKLTKNEKKYYKIYKIYYAHKHVKFKKS